MYCYRENIIKLCSLSYMSGKRVTSGKRSYKCKKYKNTTDGMLPQCSEWSTEAPHRSDWSECNHFFSPSHPINPFLHLLLSQRITWELCIPTDQLCMLFRPAVPQPDYYSVWYWLLLYLLVPALDWESPFLHVVSLSLFLIPLAQCCSISSGLALVHAPKSWVILEIAVHMWKELCVILYFIEELSLLHLLVKFLYHTKRNCLQRSLFPPGTPALVGKRAIPPSSRALAFTPSALLSFTPTSPSFPS